MKRLIFRAQNARFWEFVNNQWVRLTLRAGQRLSWARSSWNGEGWSTESIVWEYDGERVFRYCVDAGRDCDGYSSHSYSQVCPLVALADVPRQSNYNAPGVRRPAWVEDGPTRVYDQYAEAAGY